jgi:hypothetical protein
MFWTFNLKFDILATDLATFPKILGEFLFNFLVTLLGRLAISNLIGWDDLEANQLIACKVGEI